MTQKQLAVARDLTENVGKPVSRAMLDAGYSPSAAEQPQRLTRSKAWQELMEEHLPDEDLVKVHKEGLAASKVISSASEPDYTVADYAVRHKYLETAYKLKGKLVTDPINLDLKVLVIAGEALEKYEIAPSTEPSSQGQEQIPSS